MKRRNFLSLGAIAVATAISPSIMMAKDYRKSNLSAWEGDKSHKVADAIKELYGTADTVKEGVTLSVPKVAANGGAIPVKFSSSIKAKSVAVLQDKNPESLVAVFTVFDGTIIDNSLKMKMQESGTITVIVQGVDGKLYEASKSLEVALGGCEG